MLLLFFFIYKKVSIYYNKRTNELKEDNEDKDYFLGSGELVTSFVVGNSYYINNGKTLAFTILDRT